MKQKDSATILIRADGSGSVGLGHVMRCLTLQSALLKLGIRCWFASRQMPTSLQQQIVELGAGLVPVTATDLLDEAEEILHMATRLGAGAIVLDGYQFDTGYQRKLYRKGVRLILMDDTNDRGRLYADLLINSLPHAAQLGYGDTAPEARQLLGLSYVLLREEFRHLVHASTKASARPRLLVNFGGSDMLGLSLPATLGLLKRDPSLPVTLITGSASKTSKELRDLGSRYPNLEHLHDCPEMADQLCRAGLALAAPGSSIYELVACGVPAVLLICADNQRLSAAAHQAVGWCHVFDARQQNQLALALSQTLQLWKDPKTRNLMQERTVGLVDVAGADRIAQEIVDLTGVV